MWSSSLAMPASTESTIHIVAPPPGLPDGITRYALSLSAALIRQGANVHLARLGKQPVPRPLIKLASRLGYDLVSFFRTYPLVLPFDPGQTRGIIHLSAQTQATLLGIRRKVRPTVVTVHDLITLALRDDPELVLPMKPYDKAAEALGGWGLKRADALLTVSEWTRQDVIKYLQVPPEKVHVGHNGIDHDTFRPLVVEPEFYARHGLQEGTPYVLYVGSEAPRKNLRRLVPAFARVVARVPEARLLKVGANPRRNLRDELHALIEREGITGKVIFVEQTEDCDLARFYALARVFAFPSLYEGFGLPPLEAMACGTPVAASNRSCMPEILGDAALYFDPYDIDEMAVTIVRLLEDSQLHLAARARGLRQAALYSWDRTAANALSVYCRVLGDIT